MISVGGRVNLFMTRADSRHPEKDDIDNTNYLPHADEPMDFYRKYEDDDFTPKNGRKNSQNLFDDCYKIP